MYIFIGLLIIAIGAFCQSSSYVPINKIKAWSWESYWIVQGVFAWLVFPLLGALLSLSGTGGSFGDLLALMQADPRATWLTILFGALWGVGGLTFGLSMRYLGVALGQSLALGTCSALGAILGPVFTGHAHDLTSSVIIGVVVTLIGIAIIGIAGAMKAAGLPEEERRKAVKDFNFGKGIFVALLAGFMSACFNIGLNFGQDLYLPGTRTIFQSLPATMLVTFGGFLTNACYCFFQNAKNKTWGDYRKKALWGNNLLFCCLAGLLWYSQFFGLSLGKGFLTDYPVLITFSWCILMALNVTFSNVWGIILKEWKGASKKTVTVLLIGLAVLIFSTFLPQLI
ncbi:MAG: rhamnose/proton symporter RhaT [Bacteroidales bacterium]|jgi:L-rhamnose-H+ transport protein|nr:rhamnose/proton symporter RhaT [Bacteroidales bacterium]MBR4351783.1 rhamnose/proton symporter RhaT [Bacteroidales bacterium]